MPAPFHEVARKILPNLTADNYRITSPPTWEYNCIAWAIGETHVWWWPTPGRYWPDDAPREETFQAFILALKTRGYAPCAAEDMGPGLEIVALYASNNVPTHAARRLSDGWWTSKLGPNIDIEHATLDSVAGGLYGNPVAFLCRPIVV